MTPSLPRSPFHSPPSLLLTFTLFFLPPPPSSSLSLLTSLLFCLLPPSPLTLSGKATGRWAWLLVFFLLPVLVQLELLSSSCGIGGVASEGCGLPKPRPCPLV